MYFQMDHKDRRRVVVELISLAMHRAPNTQRLVRGIAKAVRSGVAPRSAVKPAIISHIGREMYKKLWHIAEQNIEKKLLEERRFTDAHEKHVCNACLSYRSQLQCQACGFSRFCAGRAEYGECFDCEANYTNAPPV